MGDPVDKPWSNSVAIERHARYGRADITDLGLCEFHLRHDNFPAIGAWQSAAQTAVLSRNFEHSRNDYLIQPCAKGNWGSRENIFIQVLNQLLRLNSNICSNCQLFLSLWQFDLSNFLDLKITTCQIYHGISKYPVAKEGFRFQKPLLN